MLEEFNVNVSRSIAGRILCGDLNARRPRAVHNLVDMHRPRLFQGCLDRSIIHRLRASEGQDHSG